jgi:hypothetical protein
MITACGHPGAFSIQIKAISKGRPIGGGKR